MGLDNGILVYSNKVIPELSKYTDDFRIFDDHGRIVYDLCYWRKCWNIRKLILSDVLKWSGCDKFEFALTEEHIKEIIKVLSGLNKKNWNDAGGSIWEFGEQRGHIKRHIKALRTLLKVMRKHEIEVWFYDSY